MSMIANEAKISEGLIYRYYMSKEQLFFNDCRSAYEGIEQRNKFTEPNERNSIRTNKTSHKENVR